MATVSLALAQKFDAFEVASIKGRYDFDLEWTPDDSQFGGQLRLGVHGDESKPSLFAAMQEQLGLRLQSTKGTVSTIVIDRAERPTEN
jgi:uncharacterized protein (TIGR03435 family)